MLCDGTPIEFDAQEHPEAVPKACPGSSSAKTAQRMDGFAQSFRVIRVQGVFNGLHLHCSIQARFEVTGAVRSCSAQHSHRIDLRCAPSGNQTREQSNDSQQYHHTNEGNGISRAHAIEQPADEPR